MIMSHYPPDIDMRIGSDSEMIKVLESLGDRLDGLEAARIEGDNLIALGYRKGVGNFEIRINLSDREVKETKFKLPRQPGYEQRRRQIWDANEKDMMDEIQGIRVFQGSIDEVALDICRPLQRVDTDSPETFIRASDTNQLRFMAYRLGADLVVHYQPGSSIGTPVKYSD